MYKLSVFLAVLCVTGCQRWETGQRETMQPWIGQPVRAFAEANSLVPAGIDSTPSGRTYIFQKAVGYSSCGVTVWAVPSGSEYVIISMQSRCPPGTL